MMSGLPAVVRAAMAPLLTQTYTRTPITQGTEDAWGEAADTAGTAVAGLSCVLVWEDRLVVDDTGRRKVQVPALYVPYDDVLAQGDRVSAVKDAAGATIEAGPFTVETLDPAAGFGLSALRIATLRAAEVSE